MQFRIQRASLVDRENPVAEIWHNDQYVAEISQETEEFQLDIYPNPDPTSNGVWSFDLDAFLVNLEEAKRTLREK
ncbi:hypothetical protein Q2T42_13500 [Leptolyngbya boryana CZ1]|jgi:hypothetical protein|uniref:Uncharacterized protein n=2 Tax=Leptolyngbya boryana TaxID=1184 RepID=A0A1Z4J9X6_LEPBY|nr:MULTISPECIES: hypothetical protein [Leptolyngbya]BAY53562.1 hypothetical protein NIES2135_03680 [Leptolyngbya boryana NIES-2135]MBD2366578.1 hypothetical protein [Leptolyngbya sp. FACHB-161]MBD2373410.1 hypothetical protein [Leptolyngbya sp. FACHB-238]MBD2397808.1 hypothetical protein [Leptolyngbya sp. FACHB-239]MBD2407469.1 hypothetical protein [Leptolyngbya sp. FACHB-402]